MTEPLVITRVTHSCHLIQIGGMTVLTDPWFTQRPFYHQGKPIALQPEQLPHLDAVVISHEHYDLKPGQLPTVRRTSPIPVRASVDHLWCLAAPLVSTRARTAPVSLRHSAHIVQLGRVYRMRRRPPAALKLAV